MVERSTNLADLAQILRQDGVIAVPTDTVYGLCARINSEVAHRRLISVKKRLSSKPFPIMCSDEIQIARIAELDQRAKRLVRRFMPGPITLVLPARPDLPSYANNGKTSVAVRLASSPEIAELIRRTGSPLFMTSANQGGEPTCKSLDEVEKACPLIDGILEGEPTFGMSSTIIDCTTEELKVLRSGPISLEQVLEVAQ